MPEGTAITFYSEHGATITNRLGNLIETGGDTSKVFKRTYRSGEAVPNYTLQPPAGLTIQGSPTVVSQDTLLSDLLRPNMGEYHWAACTFNPYESAANKIFDTTGVVDKNLKKCIEKYQ